MDASLDVCSVCGRGPITAGEPCRFCQPLEERLKALEATTTPTLVLADKINALAELAERSLDVMNRRVDSLASLETFGRKLEAYFAPALEGKQPPLNGDDVATKAYVDRAIERLGRSIRSEMKAPAAKPKKAAAAPSAKVKRGRSK